MLTTEKHIVILPVAVLAIAVVLACTSYAWAGREKASWEPRWKNLALEGEKPLTRFLVRLGIEDGTSFCPYPLGRIGWESFSCPYTAREVVLMSAETVTMSLVLPQEKYEHFVWFGPEDMKVYQRVRWKKSGSKWLKLYRWHQDGVARLTVRPRGDREYALEPFRWTRRRTSFYGYPTGVSRRPSLAVSEPLALIYLSMKLAHSGFKGRKSVLVFGKKFLHEAAVTFRKEKTVKLRYFEDGAEGRVKRKERVPVMVYGIEATPLEGDHSETFSLLGLQHGIEVFVEPDSGLIARIRGDNGVVGHIDLRLAHVVMRAEASSR